MITKKRKAIQAKLRRKYGYETRNYSDGIYIIKPTVDSYVNPKYNSVDMTVSVDRLCVVKNTNKNAKTSYPELRISLIKYDKCGDGFKEEGEIVARITLEELELLYKATKEAVDEIKDEIAEVERK